MLTFSITGGRCKTFAILFLVYSCMFEILQTWKKEGKFPGHFAHICMSSNGYGTVFSIFIFSPKETSQDSPSLYVNELLVNGFFLVAEYHPEGHFPSQLFWVLLTSCLRVTDFISLVQMAGKARAPDLLGTSSQSLGWRAHLCLGELLAKCLAAPLPKGKPRVSLTFSLLSLPSQSKALILGHPNISPFHPQPLDSFLSHDPTSMTH